MNNYAIDLNVNLDWILKDSDYLKKLDVTEKYAAHFHLKIDDIKKELINWLDSLGLEIYYSEIFYSSAGGDIFLHSDEIDPPNCCKLNWVYDQGNTVMHWYELNQGAELTKFDNSIGGIYWSADKENCYHVYSHIVKKPTLVNVSILHKVDNNSDHGRFAISIVPREKKKDAPKRLQWDQALEIFKPFIKNV